MAIKWTHQLDCELMKFKFKGLPNEDIAAIFNTSSSAIRHRYDILAKDDVQSLKGELSKYDNAANMFENANQNAQNFEDIISEYAIASVKRYCKVKHKPRYHCLRDDVNIFKYKK